METFIALVVGGGFMLGVMLFAASCGAKREEKEKERKLQRMIEDAKIRKAHDEWLANASPEERSAYYAKCEKSNNVVFGIIFAAIVVAVLMLRCCLSGRSSTYSEDAYDENAEELQYSAP